MISRTCGNPEPFSKPEYDFSLNQEKAKLTTVTVISFKFDYLIAV